MSITPRLPTPPAIGNSVPTRRAASALLAYQRLRIHEAAIVSRHMYYNFARIHQILRVTPAMESGISDHVWSIEDIVRLLQ